MERWFRRLARRWRRALPRRWRPRPAPTPADPLARSPAVEAFLDGETPDQVAYFVGSADPGIVDPNVDWVSAKHDTYEVLRGHIRRLEERTKELEHDRDA